MRKLLLWSCVWIGAGLCSAAEAQEVRLELSEPAAREIVRGRVPLVEVAGRVSRAAGEPLDLVIALDVSESVCLPAGTDVDGDGVTARMRIRRTRRSDGSHRSLRAWTTDPGDTVFESARADAARVLAALPRNGVRAGLLTFGEEVRIRAPLGSIDRARTALAAIRAPAEPVATDLERAIRVGQHVLRAYRADGRRKVLLILSDGRATRPWAPGIADSAARRAARAAARQGVEIHAVAIGPVAAGAGSAYAELAALTRGRFSGAGELDSLLAGPPFAGPSTPLARIEITNVTTGEAGRALRLSAGGRFDAFVRLAAGHNRLRIDALTSDGTRVSGFRTVQFAEPRAVSDGDRALARALARRALEIELADLSAVQSGVRRRLEIELER